MRDLLAAHEHLVEALGEEHTYGLDTAHDLADLYGHMERPEDTARWRALTTTGQAVPD